MANEYIIRLRRGKLTDWSSQNPILELGEPAIVFDEINHTTLIKVGTGLDKFNDLPYVTDGNGGTPIDLSNYAKKDFSNVTGFVNASNGSMFYKNENGEFVSAPITIDNVAKVINSEYSWKIPPNSIYFGLNTSIHENGGFLEYHTNSLNKNYILTDYENDLVTGSKKPIYWERGALQSQVVIFNGNTVNMNNVTTINIGVPTEDRQISKVYFNFNTAVTNFKIKVNVNGNDVADYPSGSWDNSNSGYNLGTGLQSITLNPYWSDLKTYNTILYIKADAPIQLRGDGTNPYLAIDKNPITQKPMALMEDIATSGGIPTFSTVLNAGNIANTDVNMNNHKINNVTELNLKDDGGTNIASLRTSPYADFKIFDKNGVDFFTITNQGEIYTNGVDILKTAGANKFLSGDGTYKTITNLGTTLAFTDLTDVEHSYNGMAGKVLAVKSDESGLEFVSQGGTSGNIDGGGANSTFNNVVDGGGANGN